MKIKKTLTRLSIYLLILIISIIVMFFVINIILQKQINKNLSVYSSIEKNLFQRFAKWIKAFFTNWGTIYNHEINITNQTIFSLYFNQFKWTILFTFLIFVLGFIIGNTLGITSAFKLNKSPDLIINIAIGFLVSFPLILISIFSLLLSNVFKYPSQFINEFPLSLQSLLVPCLITSFGTISIYMSRSKKITKEVILSEYYLFAKTLGMSKKQLFKKVLLKQLIINQLQSLIPFYLILFSTTLVVERIFSIPGQSIFLTYAFKYAEVDLILFFFVFNIILLFVTKFVISWILDYLNPQQKSEYLKDFIFLRKFRRRNNG